METDFKSVAIGVRFFDKLTGQCFIKTEDDRAEDDHGLEIDRKEIVICE